MPRAMKTWGGSEHELVPAYIIMRTRTHIFHHQGQITTVSRLLGRPINRLDFPLA